MKLVTPEDDEDDEESQTKTSPPCDETLKKEGDLNGKFFFNINIYIKVWKHYYFSCF